MRGWLGNSWPTCITRDPRSRATCWIKSFPPLLRLSPLLALLKWGERDREECNIIIPGLHLIQNDNDLPRRKKRGRSELKLTFGMKFSKEKSYTTVSFFPVWWFQHVKPQISKDKKGTEWSQKGFSTSKRENVSSSTGRRVGSSSSVAKCNNGSGRGAIALAIVFVSEQQYRAGGRVFVFTQCGETQRRQEQ